MKKMNYLSIILFAVTLSFVVIACNNSEEGEDGFSAQEQAVFNSLIGTWRGKGLFADVEYTFKSSKEYILNEYKYDTNTLISSKSGRFSLETMSDVIYLKIYSGGYEVTLINSNTIKLGGTEYNRVSGSGKIDDDNNTQKTTGYVNGHEYVDLGLSVKWAKCNMGANYPEQYGSYYSWGETGVKRSYYLTDYKYYNSRTGKFMSIGQNICGTQYDAATYFWGSKWRMPNKEEMQELLDNCTWEWTTINLISGFQIKGKNGNSIFLPAGGCNTGDDKSAKAGTFGQYWTGIFDKETDFYSKASSLVFTSSKYHFGVEGGYREDGLNIRPVTTYSDDGSGNGGGSGSGSGNDSGNDGETPYVTSFDFTATKSSITVKFMCNERPTSATIKYGTSTPSSTASSSISGKQVSATVSGLKSGTKYYFKCTVKNSYGSSTSDTFSAMTNY